MPIRIPTLTENEKSRPFWSVIVPTYNPIKDYLEQTLRGVLAQDPGPDQMRIEVIDDCSPSVDVAAMVQEIAGDRVKVFRSPVNRGLAGCWNTCIERAHGEWIHILHQDDLVFPGFYESLRRGIEANPQVGAACCRHSYCDENGHWHRLSILEMASSGVLPRFVEPLIREERFQCAAITVRRSTYEQIGGFNPNLSHTLDWEMWIRIANKFPIFYEPKILASWRNHSNATTSHQIRSGENIRDHAKAISIWKNHLLEDEGQRLSAIALNRSAEAGLWMARHLLAQNDFEGCVNQVNAALVCKSTFRFWIAATKIRVKAHIKRLTTAKQVVK